jgi:N-acetylglucosamine kinase-like BadF-type ATPase
MILIADSGSTKTDWVLTDKKNRSSYRTIGYNPYFIDTNRIFDSVSSTLSPALDADSVEKIYFYGAGCSNDENIDIVKKALEKCFKNSRVWVGHDMLAAARALLGRNEGFAAILGTGSNTCIYDGKQVTKNIDSLGYLLGDEGSGSYIGKKIIRDYLRGFLPPDLESKFKEKYRLKDSDIYDTLYNRPLPNRFLAGFCEFAYENKDHGHIRRIVDVSFSDFFRHLVIRYEGYEKHTFNCIGAVAHSFKNILEDVALRYDMQCGRILRSPIEDLVGFHIREEES